MKHTTEFKPISLEDKIIFDEFLTQTPPETSELTFTNLFMWRHRYKPRWTIHADCLVTLFLDSKNIWRSFQPLGHGNVPNALRFVTEYLYDNYGNAAISRVGPSFAQQYASSQYHIEEDRNNSDYVYLTQELIHLPGNKFHKKKNLFNQFVKKYEFEYKEFDSTLAPQLLELQENWCELKQCANDESLIDEDHAIYQALKFMDTLKFRGAALIVQGRVAAFSFGEMLNPETAVIHIEKGDSSFTGIYAAMNKLFCENAWSNVTYINREQDLGIEGLRRAKLSYNPHHLVPKFTLSPEKEALLN